MRGRDGQAKPDGLPEAETGTGTFAPAYWSAPEKEVQVIAGKVKASSRDFPYIEHRLSVQMDEPVESDRIKRMLRIYRERQEKIGQQMLQIEEFIHEIEDAEIRQIFELRFIEGWKQEQIAKAIHLERSSVSKKISAYMACSHHLEK